MAYADTLQFEAQQRPLPEDPLLLVVPGNDDLSSEAWARGWAGAAPETARVDLGFWAKPHRNSWVNRLNLAIDRAQRPVVVVAEGLACLAVAWWAEYEQPGAAGPLRGALMIDPPDIERPDRDPRLASFTSWPRRPLPFGACVLATRTRPAEELASLRLLAADWDCTFDTVATPAVLNRPSAMRREMPVAASMPAPGQRLIEGLLVG